MSLYFQFVCSIECGRFCPMERVSISVITLYNFLLMKLLSNITLYKQFIFPGKRTSALVLILCGKFALRQFL